MTTISAERAVVAAHHVFAALSLVVMAVVRPPPPERLKGYKGPIAYLGHWGYWVTSPFLWLALKLKATPNAITIIGLVIAVLGGILAGQQMYGFAGLVLTYGAVCDLLDGELARRTSSVRPEGAFLDSTLDRLGETAVFMGIAFGMPEKSGMMWAFAAAVASLMVSYARARGEGLSIACPSGGLERPHRLAILLFPMIWSVALGDEARVLLVEVVCAVIALGAGATAVSRIAAIHTLLRRSSGGAAVGAGATRVRNASSR